MGIKGKIIIIFCALATTRAHTHGIRLIILLALAYLLQRGSQKKKPQKSLFRRSTDSLMIASDDIILPSASLILQHALELDQMECAQRAVCRMGMREARRQLRHTKDKLLLQSLLENKIPKSKGEASFQAAASYGKTAQGNETACRNKYNKCPHSDEYVDSILAGIG